MTIKTDTDYASATLAELSTLTAKGAVSSQDLVEFYLDRIERLNGKLNAFVRVFAPEARLAAVALDNERQSGRARGPLHGLPVAVKDIFHSHGHRTQAGSHAYSIAAEADSAMAVQRLEQAGMIVLGKTQTTEFAYGGWGVNEITGTPWNPCDLNTHRVPGGSSSGSAVAVASGMVPAALGSDTGGSCRAPAAYCGCIGVKPSYGLIGRSGMVPLSPTLDSPGLLTRSIADTGLLLDALIGADLGDAATHESQAVETLGDIGADIQGLRVGRLVGPELDRSDAEVVQNYQAVLDRMERLGAIITEFQFPCPIDDYLKDTLNIIDFEICSNFQHLAVPEGSPIQPSLRDRILATMAVPQSAFAQYVQKRSAAQKEMSVAMDGVDVLATPTCAMPAIPVVDADVSIPTTPYTRMANYLDMAAISVPSGRTAGGLPTGIQFIARQFEERTMLRVARAVEAVTPRMVACP